MRRIRLMGMESNIRSKSKFNKKYYAVEHGTNSRLDEVQASILNVKLGFIKYYISRRRQIAKIYNDNKATCLSVLTDKDYFRCYISHIKDIKEEGIKLPILCKDFFVHKWQLYAAKSFGADAILIILAGIEETLANELYEEALKLSLSVIIEVHTIEEAEYALRFKDALIGINNRNLKTLKTDIQTTYEINNALRDYSGPLICESGINSKEMLLEIERKTKIKTFLIGESLLKNLDKNSIFSVL